MIMISGHKCTILLIAWVIGPNKILVFWAITVGDFSKETTKKTLQGIGPEPWGHGSVYLDLHRYKVVPPFDSVQLVNITPITMVYR